MLEVSHILWWWMDMHRDGCSGEWAHTRVCLMYAVPHAHSVTYVRRAPVPGKEKAALYE